MRPFCSMTDVAFSSYIALTHPFAKIFEPLYDKYGLTKPERAFIEFMIKPME